MSAFADSSALVKLYSDEEHADVVRALSDVAVSQLARVEVPAAIWRKHRERQIGAESAVTLAQQFAFDYEGSTGTPPRFVVIAITGALLARAAAICGTHRLSAYDAVQLASATFAREQHLSLTEFAALDRELRGAAAAEGFALVPALS